jgi:hypothetical protein
MGSVYIKNELKKLLVVTFREVFAKDTDFPYNNDISESSLLVSTRYATPKTDALLPQLIVNADSYGGGNDSFFNNFFEESKGSVAGTITHKKFTKVIQFQASIDAVSSNKEECEFLADKVFNILNHEYAALIQLLGLYVSQITVGDTAPKTQYPQYSFVSSIGVLGTLRLEWAIGAIDDQRDLFRTVKFNISTIVNENL